MNLALLTAAGLLTCAPQDGAAKAVDEAPVEYGQVRWSRQLESTLASAKDSGKPVVLCFQEVPG